MNSANSKTCLFLLKTPGRCQINLQLFCLRKNSSNIAVFAYFLPSRETPLAARPICNHFLPNAQRRGTLNPGNRSLRHPLPQTLAQTIDPLRAYSFKSHFSYGAGMMRAWPTCKRRGSSFGLAAISASTLTPYFRAITLGVSPALTVWVRGVAVGVVGGEPAPADSAGAG